MNKNIFNIHIHTMIIVLTFFITVNNNSGKKPCFIWMKESPYHLKCIPNVHLKIKMYVNY